MSPGKPPLSKGFTLFQLYGITIAVDYSWFIIFGLVTWSLAIGYFPRYTPDLPPALAWSMGALSALLLFGSVLLHELAHSYVAIRHSIPVERITLFLFGGMAQITREARDSKTEFQIAVAGPICSFALALLFWLLTLGTRHLVQADLFVLMFGYLTTINMALAIFNLIPGFPLDGGRMLRAYLWRKYGDFARATYTASRVGKGVALALIFLGFVQIFAGNLIGGLWLVFIGMFLQQAAEAGYSQVMGRELLAGLMVRDFMTQAVITLSPTMTLEQAVEEAFFRHAHICYPVTDQGTLVGILTLDHIKEIPRQEWKERRVQEVMSPPTAENTVSPETSIYEVLAKMGSGGTSRLPVVQGQKLVGIITRRDVMNLLQIRSGLRGADSSLPLS
ncbi:MAG: CBS domain-containing protein [Nitrospinota bacterium]|nr:MAG: CBS domain-containing protein [Nitrospinota bacterium]